MTIRIINGDVIDVLRGLPADSVQCCVTSPPYWALRSYLPKDHPNKSLELGSEKTPEEFIANLVAVFAEVRRVLRPTGVCFVNMGDSFSSEGGQRLLPLSDTQAAWLAALIDGEGCIQIHSQSRPGVATTFQVDVSVGQKDDGMVKHAYAVTGLGSCCLQNRGVWDWSVRGQQASELLKRIYKFLILKQRQAAAAIELARHVDECKFGNGRPVTEEAMEYRLKLKAACCNANQREPCEFEIPEPNISQAIPPGNLLMMPHRLALSLQADGWIVRNDVVWAKVSPMPESVNGWRWEQCRVKVGNKSELRKSATNKGSFNEIAGNVWERDALQTEWTPCPGCRKCLPNGGLVLRRGAWRHTRSHEFVFMLAKSGKYFCDAQAVAQRAVGGTPGNVNPHKHKENGTRRALGLNNVVAASTRNPRSVLHLSSELNKAKHYAAFPTELIRPLLLACTSAEGHCVQCGMPKVRIVERVREATRPGTNNKRTVGDEAGNCDPERHVSRTNTLGWKPTCDCQAEFVPATVLDPFCGTGTTGCVAKRLGLHFVGIDLFEDYCAIARKRLGEEMPLFGRKPA